jgi:hypothetical protein
MRRTRLCLSWFPLRGHPGRWPEVLFGLPRSGENVTGALPAGQTRSARNLRGISPMA